MLRRVLLMVGVIHTFRVVDLCYVHIRSTIAHIRLSIR